MNHFKLIDWARGVEDWAVGRILAQIDGLQAAIAGLGIRLQKLEDRLKEYIDGD